MERLQLNLLTVFGLALLPTGAHAQDATSSVPLFEIAGRAVTLIDLLPFAIASAGILGLLLIRRHSQFL